MDFIDPCFFLSLTIINFSHHSCGLSHPPLCCLVFICVYKLKALHLIQSFLSTPLYASLSRFYPFSDSLIFMNSACLSVSFPGVARVKLTRPDKDNSLTHSVVYFSPLLFPRFHSIPLLSLTPLPYILLFSRHRLFILTASIHPSSILFSSLVGNLFHPVIYLSRCLLLHAHALLPASVHPSVFLAISLYVCLLTDQSVFICIHTSH